VLNIPWIIKAIPPPENVVSQLEPQTAEPGGLLQWWYQQTGSFEFLQNWVVKGEKNLSCSSDFTWPRSFSFQHSCIGEDFQLALVEASPESASSLGQAPVVQRQKLLELLILKTPRNPGDLQLWKYPAADQLWFWRHGFSAASLQSWLQRIEGVSGALICQDQESCRLPAYPTPDSFAVLGRAALHGKKLVQMPRIRVRYWRETRQQTETFEKCNRSEMAVWWFQPFVLPYNTRLGQYPGRKPERLGDPEKMKTKISLKEKSS